PNWVTDDFLQTDLRNMGLRARRGLQHAWRRVLARLPGARRARRPRALEDVLDLVPGELSLRSQAEHNYGLWTQYQPRTYRGCITLFRARARPLSHTAGTDGQYGGLAAGGLDVHVVRGNHHSILKEPGVRELARRLQECLDAGVRTGE